MLKSLNDQIFKSLKHSDEAKTPNSETQIAKKCISSRLKQQINFLIKPVKKFTTIFSL